MSHNRKNYHSSHSSRENPFDDDIPKSPENSHINMNESASLLGYPKTSGEIPKKYWVATIVIGCIALLIGGLTTFLITASIAKIEPFESNKSIKPKGGSCGDSCSYKIAESIPMGLDLETNYTTYEAFSNLISSANTTLDIIAFYMTLNSGTYNVTGDYGQQEGQEIYKLIEDAGRRGVDVRIVRGTDIGESTNDTNYLMEQGLAQVRVVNVSALVEGLGSGILHTKAMIVDSERLYVGSANYDWRSLTQVKELGIVIEDCECYGKDATAVFNTLWDLGGNSTTSVPKKMPKSWKPLFNMEYPSITQLNGEISSNFFSASPPAFDPKERTTDIDAVLNMINNAEEFVWIQVMDYSPTFLYASPNNTYWPDIDDALRSAAFNRGVKVQLMMSKWRYSNPEEFLFLQSLNQVGNITTQIFVVPDQEGLPYMAYTRVNHAKYMVTDKGSYITTSNWSADYFENTCGLTFVSNSTKLKNELVEKYTRDWTSQYAQPMPYCGTVNMTFSAEEIGITQSERNYLHNYYKI